MRTELYRIYPKNLTFIPSSEAVEAGRKLLAGIFPSCLIDWETYEHPHFLHSGDAFVRVTCCLCGQELDARDWQDMMQRLYAVTLFRTLDVVQPCCGGRVSLDRLLYEKSCAFASCCYILKPGSVATCPSVESVAACLPRLHGTVFCPDGWAQIAEERCCA